SGGSCRLHRSRDANRGFWVSHCCSWRARVPRKRVRVRGGEGMGDEGLGTAEIPPKVISRKPPASETFLRKSQKRSRPRLAPARQKSPGVQNCFQSSAVARQ